MPHRCKNVTQRERIQDYQLPFFEIDSVEMTASVFVIVIVFVFVTLYAVWVNHIILSQTRVSKNT